MKSKEKESWTSVVCNMLIADAIAQHSTKGTLGQKHAEKIALRYALKSRAIDRVNNIRRFLLFTGAVSLIAWTIANWR